MSITIVSLEDFQAARAQWTELVELGELERALALVEAAMPWVEASGDAALCDVVFCNRASIALHVREDGSFVSELREILMRTEDIDTAFLASNTIARHYELRKDSKKGLFYSQIARDYAQQLGPLRQASSWNRCGNLFAMESRFQEAADAYERAEALMPGSEEVKASIIGYNLGYCFVVLGRHNEGLRRIYSSVRVLRRRGVDLHEMKARLDLAFALLETSRPNRARRHAEAALRIASQLNDADARKNAFYLLGASAQALGDRAGARREFVRLQRDFYPESEYLPDLLLQVDLRQLINLKA